MRPPSPGLNALAAFFTFGALASGTSCVTLLFSGTPLDAVWRLNPRGHDALHSLGAWGVGLMAAVCVACALAARGIWIRAPWGYRLALTIVVVNVVADTLNAVALGDRRTLIGIPIGGALIGYLLSPRVRTAFRIAEAAA